MLYAHSFKFCFSWLLYGRDLENSCQIKHMRFLNFLLDFVNKLLNSTNGVTVTLKRGRPSKLQTTVEDS